MVDHLIKRWLDVSTPVQVRAAAFYPWSCSNQLILAASSICGCFYCLRQFHFSQITQWVSDRSGSTALCPYCHVDAVIPDPAQYDKSYQADTSVPSKVILADVLLCMRDEYLQVHPFDGVSGD